MSTRLIASIRKHGRFLPLCLLLVSTTDSRAGDWPQWRGPERNGISAESDWSGAWPAGGPAVAWKASLGVGFSSFVVAGGRAYCTGNSNNTDTLFCFDAADGRLVWQHSWASDLGDKYFEGGTTGSPTVEGGRLYVLSRWGDAFCLDAATGKPVWSKNVQKETGLRIPGWGFSGSPLVLGERVILNMGEAGAALDKATGTLAWKSANKDSGYSTPLPLTLEGRTQVVMGSSQSYLAVDPLTGKEAWRVRWLTQYSVNAADPIPDGDRLLISTGYGKGATLVKIGAGEPEVLWKSKAIRSQMNPGVRLGAFVYAIDGDTTEKAALKCIEFSTGAEKWTFPGVGSGAVTAAGGRLLVLTAAGELLAGPASPEGFTPSGRAQVLSGKCWTVPVLAQGRLYCRNARGDALCLDLRKK